MCGIFIYSYALVFYPTDGYPTYVFTLGGMTHFLISLVAIIMSGADCNCVAKQAGDIINSLPGWFPQHYEMLKMHIRQKFKKTFVLTLWKVYVIKESLLVSALGTLITYGFLVGTIGIVQGLDAESH
ncbi:uncharacterized protein NPIL_164571 [Nephila pilipes]|uniref:Uncharacterized protein n=1 Tax=Nephila pilipes TaxID=299642 RepID=A0A8X6Q963_NEPPI|nr:uncharacterized protein NPIL_164571 [Nephila pilipes]